jgi:hypothetical protein
MTIPPELLWPGVVVIAVIAIFLTAALAGPLIHANTRDEIDSTDDPDRPAGSPPRSS